MMKIRSLCDASTYYYVVYIARAAIRNIASIVSQVALLSAVVHIEFELYVPLPPPLLTEEFFRQVLVY